MSVKRLPLILILLAALLRQAHADLSDFSNTNRSTLCGIDQAVYWKFISWYFSRSLIMHVTILRATKDSYRYADSYNEVVKNFMAVSMLPVYLHSRELDFEGERVASTSDFYDWSGVKFELRDSQKTEQQRIITKRDTTSSSSLPRSDRKDEPGLGKLVVVENENVLDEYLQGTARAPFLSPRDNYIIIVRYVLDADNYRMRIEEITKRMWTRYGIESVFVMTPCREAADNENVVTYFPFDVSPNVTEAAAAAAALSGNASSGALASDDYGQCKWYSIDNMEYSMRILRRLGNMNGYPFRVSIFNRYPTALLTSDMPRVIARSYYNKESEYSGGFGGFDGLVLGYMAHRLNFRTVVVPPVGSDFGYIGDNGTFYGSLGDVLYGRAQISFNGRFVADYGTDELDYLYPVYFDRFCIIAPKSLRIPEWLAIFRCFSTPVWMTLIATNILCAFSWYFLNVAHINNMKQTRRRKKQAAIGRPSFAVIFIEMWNIMSSAVSTKLPHSSSERIFMTACLLVNVIISGSFQGTLTKSYSTIEYYKEINTLQELVESGLPIGTTSASLSDIFGAGQTPLLKALISRFFLFKIGPPIMDRTAYNRDICCIERCGDFQLISVSKYEGNDGMPLLHAIGQSPKTCHIAYIIKKGWPYAMVFIETIHRLTEAGLLQKWYKENQDAIIQEVHVNRRNDDDQLRKLSLNDLQTAFYILGIGLSVCLVVLLGENVHSRRRGKRRLRTKLQASKTQKWLW